MTDTERAIEILQEMWREFKEYRLILSFEDAIDDPSGERADALMIAQVSTEKQVAVKPSVSGKTTRHYACPSCKGPIGINANHCFHCGQKLDWEGDDE